MSGRVQVHKDNDVYSGGLLDAATRDLVVRALCQTPLWKRATDLLDKPQPSSEATNAVAVAAFAHGDHASAWQCLERLWGSSPLRVFPATLEACLGAAATLAESDRPDEGRRLVDRLLAHLAQSKGPVPSALALDLAGFYDKLSRGLVTKGAKRSEGRETVSVSLDQCNLLHVVKRRRSAIHHFVAGDKNQGKRENWIFPEISKHGVSLVWWKFPSKTL